jgi:hypothetical protein
MGSAFQVVRMSPSLAPALPEEPAGARPAFKSKMYNRGLAEDALSTDDMLDAISLYWFTNSAASSSRI